MALTHHRQQRKKKVSNQGATGTWNKFEDSALKQAVEAHGPYQWRLISDQIRNCNVFRNSKQCRERWVNHLSPDIKKKPWSEQEDMTIVKGQKIHGHSWSKIARVLPGRSDNDVKNRWNTKLGKGVSPYYLCLIPKLQDVVYTGDSPTSLDQHHDSDSDSVQSVPTTDSTTVPSSPCGDAKVTSSTTTASRTGHFQQPSYVNNSPTSHHVEVPSVFQSGSWHPSGDGENNYANYVGAPMYQSHPFPAPSVYPYWQGDHSVSRSQSAPFSPFLPNSTPTLPQFESSFASTSIPRSLSLPDNMYQATPFASEYLNASAVQPSIVPCIQPQFHPGTTSPTFPALASPSMGDSNARFGGSSEFVPFGNTGGC